MASNVNPTDPKSIDGADLDTEGHRRYSSVSPTEQDTAGLTAEGQDSQGFRVVVDEDDDTEGHARF